MIKSLVKDILDDVQTISYKDLEGRLKKYDEVSFDIFDTLIKRNVPKPIDVFQLMEECLGYNDFCKNRVRAEIEARKLSGEVTLKDIYTVMTSYDDDIKEAYKRVEYVASKKMVDKLPDYMKKHYEKLFFPQEDKAYEWRLVKAADKLSALIKCKQELNSGNQEFKTAYETTKKALHDMNMEEVEVFMQDFLPAYDLTLDELQAK